MQLIIENLDKIISISLMLIFSIYIRILLQFLGQSWIKTVAHTSTLVLLPILTYVITNVISGNIALSLGMVGALSIVRFRNPVRSPLELTVYFGAITMGITAGFFEMAFITYWLSHICSAFTFSFTVHLKSRNTQPIFYCVIFRRKQSFHIKRDCKPRNFVCG